MTYKVTNGEYTETFTDNATAFYRCQDLNRKAKQQGEPQNFAVFASDIPRARKPAGFLSTLQNNAFRSGVSFPF